MTRPEHLQPLRGKVALVTGASRRIGAAAAKRLAQGGASVVINYHQSRERALEVLQEVEKAGGRGMIFQADVTQPRQVEAMGQAIREKFSAVDVLANNAYFAFEVGTLHELPWESLHRAIEHEIAAFYNCTQVFVPGMIEKNPARLSSSVHVWLSSRCPGWAPTLSTKGPFPYQRHLRFFKRHPEVQGHFANHVADEMIHRKPPGHIRIVLEQGRHFGLTDEEMIEYEMLPECRAFLEYFRGTLYEGTMGEWWASFCVEEGVGHWAKFFGSALRDAYKIPEEKIVYFTVHAEADLEVHADGILGHADLDWMVLRKILEEGRGDTRPGFSLEYCLRMGTAYFAWFFEGVYQSIKKEGLYRL